MYAKEQMCLYYKYEQSSPHCMWQACYLFYWSLSHIFMQYGHWQSGVVCRCPHPMLCRFCHWLQLHISTPCIRIYSNWPILDGLSSFARRSLIWDPIFWQCNRMNMIGPDPHYNYDPTLSLHLHVLPTLLLTSLFQGPTLSGFCQMSKLLNVCHLD